jgi:predicted enzyme related to lactoylglutathione lyase
MPGVRHDPRSASVERMTIQRMEHVGIVVDDLAAVTASFVELGLELVKFHAPTGPGGDRHAPANTPGIRHLEFAVDDIDAVVAGLRARGAELVGEVENYEDIYRLCYVRGPEGIIVELAHKTAEGSGRPPTTASAPRAGPWFGNVH